MSVGRTKHQLWIVNLLLYQIQTRASFAGVGLLVCLLVCLISFVVQPMCTHPALNHSTWWRYRNFVSLNFYTEEAKRERETNNDAFSCMQQDRLIQSKQRRKKYLWVKTISLSLSRAHTLTNSAFCAQIKSNYLSIKFNGNISQDLKWENQTD